MFYLFPKAVGLTSLFLNRTFQNTQLMGSSIQMLPELTTEGKQGEKRKREREREGKKERERKRGREREGERERKRERERERERVVRCVCVSSPSE